LGYSPFTLVLLFLLYEAMGLLANLIGGWLATRDGIARSLTVGLCTQITGLVLLSQLSPGWTVTMSVAGVVAGVVAFVPALMGQAKALKSAKELFAKNRAINLLAAARVALFGARDLCFVGFYQAANALGRFIGTLPSGLLCQWGGLLFSLSGSAAMLVSCWLITLALPDKLALKAPHAVPARPVVRP